MVTAHSWWPSKIRMQRLLPAALFFLLFPAHAFAWGYTGHRIIAEIAERFLEPGIRRILCERTDERGRETERAPQSTATAPVLDSTYPGLIWW
jgi:hypothetical protein